MEYEIQRKDKTVIVLLPTEVDHHIAERIRGTVDEIIQNDHISTLIFDFKNTEFMDSSGVGMIIGRYKLMRYMGGSVSAVHVNMQMQRVLRVSGLYKILDIEDIMTEQGQDQTVPHRKEQVCSKIK